MSGKDHFALSGKSLPLGENFSSTRMSSVRIENDNECIRQRSISKVHDGFSSRSVPSSICGGRKSSSAHVDDSFVAGGISAEACTDAYVCEGTRSWNDHLVPGRGQSFTARDDAIASRKGSSGLNEDENAGNSRQRSIAQVKGSVFSSQKSPVLIEKMGSGRNRSSATVDDGFDSIERSSETRMDSQVGQGRSASDDGGIRRFKTDAGRDGVHASRQRSSGHMEDGNADKSRKRPIVQVQGDFLGSGRPPVPMEDVSTDKRSAATLDDGFSSIARSSETCIDSQIGEGRSSSDEGCISRGLSAAGYDAHASRRSSLSPIKDPCSSSQSSLTRKDMFDETSAGLSLDSFSGGRSGPPVPVSGEFDFYSYFVKFLHASFFLFGYLSILPGKCQRKRLNVSFLLISNNCLNVCCFAVPVYHNLPSKRYL